MEKKRLDLCCEKKKELERVELVAKRKKKKRKEKREVEGRIVFV